MYPKQFSPGVEMGAEFSPQWGSLTPKAPWPFGGREGGCSSLSLEWVRSEPSEVRGSACTAQLPSFCSP